MTKKVLIRIVEEKDVAALVELIQKEDDDRNDLIRKHDTEKNELVKKYQK